MKKITIAILALMMAFAGNKVSAQGKYGADSANCIKYLSYYKEYFKQKAYDDALPNWRKAYAICPRDSRQTLLIDGTTLIRKEIARNFRNPVYKSALIDSLMTLHEERAKYFPKYAVTALNNKGLDMANYVKDDNRYLYAGINDIIERNGAETKANLYLLNLNSAIELYKTGVLGAEEVIATYERNIGLLDSAPAANAAIAEQNKKVRTDLENLFISSKVASCDDLLALFTPRFEADPDNLELVTNIVKMLNIAEDCQDNDLYLGAVTSLYKLNPSHNSAYYLYRLHSARNNFEEAVKYMEEAIASEDSDAATDASYNYELATYCFKNGRLVKAYGYASSAKELDESYAGKAWVLMGQIWGATACGGDEVEKRSHYWVAVDMLQKARAADASLAEEAGRLIGSYSVYFPETGDAFMYGVTDGQSYRVNCGGLSAVTTVRTSKK